jgi:hypothetical protein
MYDLKSLLRPVSTKLLSPNHDPIAKGTLNDILTKVSIWNQISKDDLIKRL